ncbi:MAG: DHH family phosphoesterase [Burkholderiales bacterium]
MIVYDVFNGDADGIGALLQLRLAQPRPAALITGVKRDIKLLQQVPPQAGVDVTVLDISLAENVQALDALLQAGAKVRYFDHHHPGTIPGHPGLEVHIDTSPEVCTSLLVDRFLHGSHRIWAVVAAFGDNLEASARRAAEPLRLAETQIEELRNLGEAINYNAYGETVADLFFHPTELYRRLYRHAEPFSFIAEDEAFPTLRDGFANDIDKARRIAPETANASCALYILPNERWSRRVSGAFSNTLVDEFPDRAHAVLTARGEGYIVSVRAPRSNPRGAQELCRRFATGGGREAAAGIQVLPSDKLENFSEQFCEFYR